MYSVRNTTHYTTLEIDMATVDKATALKIIASDGYYSNDPRVHQVLK